MSISSNSTLYSFKIGLKSIEYKNHYFVQSRPCGLAFVRIFVYNVLN